MKLLHFEKIKDHVNGFFSCKGGAKGRLSRYVEIFWNKKGFSLLFKRNRFHVAVRLISRELKGPGKRGHIVADTLLPTQMFPRLSEHATFVANTNCVRDTKNVSDFVQKHFVSATYVFQFAQPKKHHGQQRVGNNVSSFARALRKPRRQRQRERR